MLNEKQQRELAYVVKIDAIQPIPGKDRVECACVGGWTVMVRKDSLRAGDIAVYFEIDSKCPETEEFAFLERVKYKIKTQKYSTGDGGKFYSQGLIMNGADFGWKEVRDENGTIIEFVDGNKKYHLGDFLTERIGVSYEDPADNARKEATDNSAVFRKHKKFFSNRLVKSLMRYKFFRKIFLAMFGAKKKKKKSDYPYWVVKTDEERIQNIPRYFPVCETEWITTEKIDGSSSTFTMRNDKKRNLLVCSRNVLFDTPAKEERNFYKDSCGNIWLEISGKYGMRDKLSRMIDYIEADLGKKVEFVTIQGEIYGGSIQKRNYGDEHRLAVFNVIYKTDGDAPIRLNPIEGSEFCKHFELPYVPVIDEHVILPATCTEVVEMAGGKSVIDGGMREGLVFRSYDGKESFKAVDPEFLVKFHG